MPVETEGAYHLIDRERGIIARRLCEELRRLFVATSDVGKGRRNETRGLQHSSLFRLQHLPAASKNRRAYPSANRLPLFLQQRDPKATNLIAPGRLFGSRSRSVQNHSRNVFVRDCDTRNYLYIRTGLRGTGKVGRRGGEGATRSGAERGG